MPKVAVYCRVSTEKDAQINSLENQKTFFGQYIAQKTDWELSKIYVDEGISGTNIKKRQGFLQMLADGQNHQFQLLLTKEISRFARNTLDSIYYTRKLKEWGIGVLFLNDNINTLDPDAELRLTIMASIAQEESRKTSERVKWGQKRQMEKGTVFGHSLFGYTLHQGKLEILPEQAEIIQLIFDKFTHEKKGAYTIAKELTEKEIPTPSGKTVWSHSVILKILKNEKYAGDLIQKKTYTPNYLTHQKKINYGQEPLVILEQHHAPIIQPALFQEAQQILAERAQKQYQKQSRYSHKHCLSGKLICGHCNTPFIARTKKKQNKTYLYWQCRNKKNSQQLSTHTSVASCSSCILSQPYLEQILTAAVATIWGKPTALCLESLCQNMLKGINQANACNSLIRPLEKQLQQIGKDLEKLLQLYLKDFITAEEYQQQKKKYAIKRQSLQQTLEQAKEKTDVPQEERIKQIEIYCREILTGTRFAPVFYRELLQQVTIIEKNQWIILWQKFPYEMLYQTEQ